MVVQTNNFPSVAEITPYGAWARPHIHNVTGSNETESVVEESNNSIKIVSNRSVVDDSSIAIEAECNRYVADDPRGDPLCYFNDSSFSGPHSCLAGASGVLDLVGDRCSVYTPVYMRNTSTPMSVDTPSLEVFMENISMEYVAELNRNVDASTGMGGCNIILRIQY